MKLESDPQFFDSFRIMLGGQINFELDVLQLLLSSQDFIPNSAQIKRQEIKETSGGGYSAKKLQHEWKKDGSSAVLFFERVQFEAVNGEFVTRYWILHDISRDVLIAYGNLGSTITITDGNILTFVPPKTGFLRLE